MTFHAKRAPWQGALGVSLTVLIRKRLFTVFLFGLVWGVFFLATFFDALTKRAHTLSELFAQFADAAHAEDQKHNYENYNPFPSA
jgi:hypothetical protein